MFFDDFCDYFFDVFLVVCVEKDGCYFGDVWVLVLCDNILLLIDFVVSYDSFLLELECVCWLVVLCDL